MIWPNLREFALSVVVILTIACGSAFAQAAPPDYNGWERVAASIATDLDESRLSDEGFATLRASLVEWRGRFLKAQDTNKTQIETLLAQIDALGPAPAEGESEPQSVATRRAALNTELADAREPKIQAEEAYARADALIGRIDAVLRARQTDAFFELEPSPLAPTQWGLALQRLIGVGSRVQEEVVSNISSLEGRTDFRKTVPGTIALVLIALILITRGPRFAERQIVRVEKRSGEVARVVWGFVVSLAAILLPLIGISTLNGAILLSGVLGETGRGLALGLNLGIVIYVVSRWLGNRIFPESDALPSPFSLNKAGRAEGRLLARTLGILIGVMVLLYQVDAAIDFETSILSVLSFPVLLIMGLVYFRLGRLMLRESNPDTADEGAGFTIRLEHLLGRILQVIGIGGPILAAIGYFNSAAGILVPTGTSLALLAFLTALHFVIRSGYALATGRSAGQATDALPPVLITLALTILSLPIFALQWGARPTDLLEIWTRFRTGFRVGDTTISPTDFINFGIVLALGLLATRLLQGTLRSTVLPRTKIDKGGRNALVSGLGYLGVTIAVIVAVTAAGIDISSLALVVGALGVGIGFGLQNIVNNFVSGIILLIERPISEGDWIEVNNQTGIVKSISVRSTVIETFDRTDVIVPNGDFISGTVTNWTRGNSIGRVIVPVGVAYGTDTRKVERILKEIAKAHPIVAMTPEPAVLFRGFGADSLDFEIRAILSDVNYLLSVHSDMNHEIAKRFEEEGIEIPFAQRDIWLRNPEALNGATRSQSPDVAREDKSGDSVDLGLIAPDADAD